MLYKFLLKPLLFIQDPEKAHLRVFSMMKSLLSVAFIRKIVKRNYVVNHQSLEKELFGLKFKNPIGLAAGFDKDAKLFEELGCLGFGFVEVGTVTPKAQEGNPKPRLFRLPKDEALINRMGFNNEGLDAMLERLKQRKKGDDLIIGGNIGKNKSTANASAEVDYIESFNALFQYVDYFVVNVSSPNTPNLRELQEKEPLTQLLKLIQAENAKKPTPKPILLKIAPDLTNSQLDDIVDIVKETKLSGLIATNTTINRSSLKTVEAEVQSIGVGGLSGKPLKDRSTEVIQYLSKASKQHIPIIAVGGIFTAEDAIEKLEAGADLVQMYTGFIYEGPAIVKKINKKLIQYYEKRST